MGTICSKSDTPNKRRNITQNYEKEESPKIESKPEINNENYITGIIFINQEDLNRDIRIINSYDQYKRENLGFAKDDYYKNSNEREIKNNCEIKINNTLIPFSFYHRFQTCGKHTIEYSFKKFLTNSSALFWGCNFITSLDFSNFNTEHITNMSLMFGGCESLTELNLSNFKTKNVINMQHMFNGCKSLTHLDLTQFDTRNVTNMVGMLEKCKSLTKLDLSNFNTQKVTTMVFMFCDCESLIDLDISNFNTINVADAGDMLEGCYSLKNIRIKDTTQTSQSSEFMLSISYYWPIINSHQPKLNK